MQVSRSKKWEFKPAPDEDGNPLLPKTGKKILRHSYSVLQDDFFRRMGAAGYTDADEDRAAFGARSTRAGSVFG